jgi:hypothetical protein
MYGRISFSQFLLEQELLCSVCGSKTLRGAYEKTSLGILLTLAVMAGSVYAGVSGMKRLFVI